MDAQHNYQQAIKEAASAAWDHDWARALQAYQEALEYAPDDVQALAGLALCYLETRRYEEARATYTHVSELVPSDPLPHEKLGEIYSTLGQYAQAANHYFSAAEVYYARRDMQRAISNWQEATQLNVDHAQAHMRLAVIYESSEKTRQDAVYEYLHVARLLQKNGQSQRAEQAVERALNIDPINPDVRAAKDDLRKGEPIEILQEYHAAVYPQPTPGQMEQALHTQEESLLEPVEEARGPIEKSTREAMGLLADIIWTGEVPAQASSPLLSGIDAYQFGEMETAIEHFLQAQEAGLSDPGLFFILGVLYQQMRKSGDTIDMLNQCIDEPQYAFVSHLILGQAYYTQGEPLKAAQHLLEALHTADNQLNQGLVDEGGYERNMDSLTEKTTEQLEELAKSLAFYLDVPDWDEKLSSMLSNYAEQGKISYVPDLIELIIEGGRPELSTIMQRIEELLSKNMIRMATEEAHYAIQKAPDYLPAHRHLADILIREARTQEAAIKLNLIANTYLVRGNAEKAADLFTEVIDLWPADTSARQRVIDLLREQGRVAETINQYAEMADLYYRLLADPDKAIEVYNQALEYGRQVDAEPALTIPILKALADIETQRLNWRNALSYYERALALDPGAEDLVLAAIDLNFQLSDPAEAIRILDNYMRQCISQGDVKRVTSILEEQVRLRPTEIPLRQRLAEVYRQQGRTQEAITQMDALGELQLDAGRLDDATATIRKIVSMNPPDIQGYQQLLEELESGRKGS